MSTPRSRGESDPVAALLGGLDNEAISREEVTYYIPPEPPPGEDDPQPGISVTYTVVYEEAEHVLTAHYVHESEDEIRIEDEEGGDGSDLPAPVRDLARTRTEELWGEHVESDHTPIV
jgi:hypothetical protein